MRSEVEGDVGSMCNLGQGILEKGFKQGYTAGEEHGREIGLIQGTVKNCKFLGIDIDKTKAALMKQFSVSEEQAEEYLNKYWQ